MHLLSQTAAGTCCYSILMLIIRSLSAAVAASGLPSELGDSSAVGRGRAGRLMQLKTHYSIL